MAPTRNYLVRIIFVIIYWYLFFWHPRSGFVTTRRIARTSFVPYTNITNASNAIIFCQNFGDILHVPVSRQRRSTFVNVRFSLDCTHLFKKGVITHLPRSGRGGGGRGFSGGSTNIPRLQFLILKIFALLDCHT